MHGNFSSGVLALSRRLAELQDQERLALASLRSGSTAPPPPPTTQRPPPTSPAPPPATPSHPDLLLTPGRCSRYQFECRRGGECVAVYNACDGVPQCADGSDEAPELGCPPAPLPPRPTTPRPQLQESQERLGVSEGLELEAAAAAAGGSERERWPHRLAQAQPQHRYSVAESAAGGGAPAGSSHIFSHKGGLLQEEAGAPYPPFEPPAPWPRRAWPARHDTEGEPAPAWGYPRLEWPAEPRRAWPVPPRADPEAGGGAGGAGAAREDAPPYLAREATLRDSAKKAPPAPLAPPPAPPSRPPPAPAPAPPPQHKPHKNKNSEPAGGGAGGAGGAGGEGAQARVSADGLSERPPAAVLLLVLGVVMTVSLGALLGCRLGAARRRLRRGKPFAHDADYLVNGMYL